ncbi:MAG: carbon monoxide dehydrogenase subunit G [Pseudomonadota bacterium]|nr:carbon monoxide dehydrogenase subunit G [Pseudomonadota bacterium]
MELLGERLIPASIDQTWAALNDPDVLKGCIAGCESIERTDDGGMAAVVALKVGPVSARFKGKITLTQVDAPNGYTLNFDGQGGIAGFGKGSADVALTAQSPQQTLLKYTARATVGGKMAQIGSRLIDATAAKITEDFFKAFEARVQATAAPEAAPESPTATLASPPLARAALPLATAALPSSADANLGKLWWLIGGVVALAAVYFLIR